jgi:formate dehydrogenase iron-sulfur subunit
MCYERIRSGLEPACVKTCPTGTMNFGEREAMLSLAQKRLETVKKTSPKAMLLDPHDVRVIYLVAYESSLYHEFSVASSSSFDITRQAALKRMLRPLTSIASRVREV